MGTLDASPNALPTQGWPSFNWVTQKCAMWMTLLMWHIGCASRSLLWVCSHACVSPQITQVLIIHLLIVWQTTGGNMFCLFFRSSRWVPHHTKHSDTLPAFYFLRIHFSRRNNKGLLTCCTSASRKSLFEIIARFVHSVSAIPGATAPLVPVVEATPHLAGASWCLAGHGVP